MTSQALIEPSFADVIAAIEQASDLTDVQKRHWTCSARQIAKALGRPPESIVARWTSARFTIGRLHHAMSGNREKTLRNHKANLRRALLWFAGEHDVPTRGAALSKEWAALRGGVVALRQRAVLSGLMRFCSARSITPETVSEAVVDAYLAYRGATTNLATNDAARRKIARAWNACAGAIEGWPSLRLIEPPIKGNAGPAWEEFPSGLRGDIEDYLASLTRPRRGIRKRIRACKASTIKGRRAELMAAVRMAARIVPLAGITSLRELLRPELAERVLNAYWDKDGDEPGTYTIDLAWKFLSIARHLRMDPADIGRLDDMRAEIETHRRTGMTPKNRALIRQVITGDVWSRVVNLPAALMHQARLLNDHAPVKAALTAQLAVAIALLTVAPVRLGNLGRIRLEENLTRPGGLGAPYCLVFPDYDVKNRVELAFPLDQRLTALLNEYIHDFRPALVRGSNELWLFPGESAAHKSLSTLGTQITDRIYKATGIRITVHQFRHAAAAIFLRHHPGEYETVRRILAHRNIQTTIRFYCELETTQATERFGEIIAEHLNLKPELA
jgi:integrase